VKTSEKKIRGIFKNNLKYIDKVLGDYNKARSFIPNYADAYNNRDNAYLK
jgi:hypothetical protein